MRVRSHACVCCLDVAHRQSVATVVVVVVVYSSNKSHQQRNSVITSRTHGIRLDLGLFVCLFRVSIVRRTRTHTNSHFVPLTELGGWVAERARANPGGVILMLTLIY